MVTLLRCGAVVGIFLCNKFLQKNCCSSSHCPPQTRNARMHVKQPPSKRNVPWILRHLKGWDPIRLGFLPRSHSLLSKGNNVNRDTFQRKLCQKQTQVQRFSLFLKNCTFSVLTYTEFGEIDVTNVCTSQIDLPRWTYKPNMFQY